VASNVRGIAAKANEKMKLAASSTETGKVKTETLSTLQAASSPGIPRSVLIWMQASSCLAFPGKGVSQKGLP